MPKGNLRRRSQRFKCLMCDRLLWSVSELLKAVRVTRPLPVHRSKLQACRWFGLNLLDMFAHAGSTLNMLAVLLLCATVAPLRAFVDELDDSLLEMRQIEDIWLIKFYAPWCSMCKQLDPVWHQIGSELKSVGSPVNVGKCDAIANAGLAKEFKVRSYPAIFMWKNDVKYLHIGPRTGDAIVKFAHRISGPLIRPLTSLKLFQHALSHHDVMFVYIGASSPLKGVFSAVAQEMIVSTFFFSASREVLPKAVSLPALPTVVVFKDAGYFSYNETSDGSLKAWIKRERFNNYANVDSYMLYAMGDSGKLVLLALLDDASVSQQNLRNIHFGFMEGDHYINGLIMGKLGLPAIVMLNLSTDSYFLPPTSLETERHLLDFLDQVLDGSIQAHGGNGVTQRVRRFIYETKVTLLPLFAEAPLLGCFLLGLPLGLVGLVCFVCRTALSDHGGQEDDDDRHIYSRRQIPEKKSD
ncbi:protein disulfide-isomerase TMX3-like isoform X4 [Phycodurus eques]|uniref:protein disulfide-isomerase TMX3-like isoform X4 n=1 Tax=Phycodurus eques TaxID=693459 RepID=UPI002ACDD68A|nr:protein disulfide-isomerase TMX3-like isoform X4 [Phycodurus eques]